MNLYSKILFILFPVFCLGQTTITLSDSDVTAFYGAVGHGSGATGSRGLSNVYQVTNLNDSGNGSLREALTNAKNNGGGTVIFRTSGTITITSDMYIGDSDADGTNENIYVAGQTAPGGGVAIKSSGSTVRPWLRGSNIILRHVRFIGGDNDALTVGDTSIDYTMQNVVIDHCSFKYGNDEILAFTTKTALNQNASGSITNVSLTNNIIGLPQDGFNFIIYGENHSNYSIIKNYITHSVERNPFVGGTGNSFEWINNLVYYTQTPFNAYPRTVADVIGNYYDRGDGNDWNFSQPTFRLTDCNTSNCPPSGDSNYTGTQLYYTDNIDKYQIGDAAEYDSEFVTYLQGSEVVSSGYTPISASGVPTEVLSNAGAGAGISQGRDSKDLEMVQNFDSGTGQFGNATQTTPALASGTPYLDQDGDGLWDEYEVLNGGLSINPGQRPVTATLVSGAIIDQSGVTAGIRYSHMDIMLGELAGDWTGGTPPTGGGGSTPDGQINETSAMLISH